MIKPEFDTLKIEMKWPIYLFYILATVSTVYNLSTVLKYQDQDLHYGIYNFNMWIALLMVGYYIVKIEGYVKFRDGNPLLTFTINRIVFLALNTLIFRSMSINWKVLIIGWILELSVGLMYILDTNMFEYIEEEVEISQ